jgi:hypothetical protein
MMPSASSHLEDQARSADVSLNTSSLIPSHVTAVGSGVAETSLSIPHTNSSMNISPNVISAQDPMGSSVPTPVLAPIVTAGNRIHKFRPICLL